MLHKLMSAAMMVVVTLGMSNLVFAQQISAVESCNPQNTANSSHECYWQAQYPGSTCVKYDGLTSKSFTVPAAPQGTEYVAAIVKAGSGEDENFVDNSIVAGDVLTHPSGKNLSHVILCYKQKRTQPSGSLSVTSDCEKITFSAMNVSPEGTTVAFTLDGTSKAAGTYDVEAGSHAVKLLLNGKEVDSKTVTVEECAQGTPSYAVSLICPVNTYKLTVSNTGDTDLDVEVNGVQKTITKGGAAITADFNVGDVLTVKVDGTPVTVEGKVLNNFKLVTCQGMGSTVTTNNTTNVVASTGFGAGAATDVTSLPVTSGSSAQAAGVIMTLGTILAAAGAYLTRSRSGLSV